MPLEESGKGKGKGKAGSLSNVVHNLVRAQYGLEASGSVPGHADNGTTDLDRHVAELLLLEAKEREARRAASTSAGAGGWRFSDDEDYSGGGAGQEFTSRTNKRFLKNVLRGVEDHNVALRRQQQQQQEGQQQQLLDRQRAKSAQSRKEELDAIRKRERGERERRRRTRASEDSHGSSRHRHPTPSKEEGDDDDGNDDARGRRESARTSSTSHAPSPHIAHDASRSTAATRLIGSSSGFAARTLAMGLGSALAAPSSRSTPDRDVNNPKLFSLAKQGIQDNTIQKDNRMSSLSSTASYKGKGRAEREEELAASSPPHRSPKARREEKGSYRRDGYDGREPYDERRERRPQYGSDDEHTSSRPRRRSRSRSRTRTEDRGSPSPHRRPRHRSQRDEEGIDGRSRSRRRHSTSPHEVRSRRTRSRETPARVGSEDARRAMDRKDGDVPTERQRKR